MGTFFFLKKEKKKNNGWKHKMALYISSGMIYFLSWNLHCSCRAKLVSSCWCTHFWSGHTSLSMSPWRVWIMCFSTQFGVFHGLGLHWTSCMEPVYVFFLLIFLRFKTSPYLVQLFRTMLQCCFTVKVQKCFVDYETSPDAWRLVDNDFLNIFGWTFPLKI